MESGQEKREQKVSPHHILVELAPPDKVSVHQDADSTVIVFDWFNINHSMSAIYFIIFGFFVYLESAVFVSDGDFSARIFLGIFLLLALLMLYHVLIGFFNQTTITVTGQSLSITYGPLPWWRGTTRQLDSFDTLFFEIDETAVAWTLHYRSLYTFYGVYVVSAGETIPIIRYIESPLVAAYLTTQIQTVLGQVTKPYWQVLLNDLDEAGTDRPLFTAEKRFPYPSEQISDAVQSLLLRRYRGKLALVANGNRTQFDALHFDQGEGKLYYLTRICINPIASATNVVVHQKTVPHIGANWGHQRTVNGFLRDIESCLGDCHWPPSQAKA